MKALLLATFALGGHLGAQTYDFSAATAQLQSNLDVYGGRVVVIVEQQSLGEIFRFESGAITQNSKIGIASCTKWLSGAIVLACAERGYFALDDRVGDYLPAFQANGKGDITIRQCFGMKSGLSLKDPDYEIFMFRIGALAIENNLHVLEHLRIEIDAKGLPPAPAPGPLASGVVDRHLRLSWTGGGTLESSPDLLAWTPLPWASSPFLESLARPPAPRLYYRVRR